MKQQTIFPTYKKFLETGSVEDRERSGRPITATWKEGLEKFRQHFDKNPMSSYRQAAAALVISHNSVQRAAREFDLHPYKPTSVVELSKDDLGRRVEFYETMLKEFHEDSALVEHILW